MIKLILAAALLIAFVQGNDVLPVTGVYNDPLTGWSTDFTSNCNGMQLVGGYPYTGTTIAKTYQLGGENCAVTVSLDYMKIDSWDDEVGQVLINGNEMWNTGTVPFPYGTQQCGALDDEWFEHAYQVSFSFSTVDEETFTLTASAGLDQAGVDESFGISNVVITTDCATWWIDDYNQLRYQTGFVCDDSFSRDAADVICKEINGAEWEVGSYQGSVNLIGCSATNGDPTHITMDEVSCPSGATELSQCSTNDSFEDCACSEGIQIVCQSTPSGPTETCPPTEGEFGFIIDGYTYEITLQGSVTQFAHSTGESWHLGDYDSSTGTYTGGDVCPNGVARSTTINWECGYPTTVTNVQEPSMCVYVYTAVSSNCCDSEKSGDICATTTHDNRCGPRFNQYCYHPYYPFCDEENGWCGSSETHDIIQSSMAYDHDTYVSQCDPSEVDPVDNVCAINPNRRCGQKYGHKYCTSRYWPYCHEYNGWCGHTEGHLNAQPSNRYNYATFLTNCPNADDHTNGNLDTCVAKSNQKCGPLYYNEYCYDSTMPYCNEENGWCGASEDHKNHQDATTYDYASFQANCGDS